MSVLAHGPEGYAAATGGAIRPAARSIGAAAIARRAVILMVFHLDRGFDRLEMTIAAHFPLNHGTHVFDDASTALGDPVGVSKLLVRY
jgi:hypothetical protein